MISYIIAAKIVKIEFKTRIANSRMVDGVATSELEELGWFMLLEGSHEYLFLGFEKPELTKGQEINIRIEPR